MSEPIKHKDCGGEIISEEAVFNGYEIASDGLGGWDYVGNIAYTVEDDSSPYQFYCGSCGWKEDHLLVIIEGAEMRGKD